MSDYLEILDELAKDASTNSLEFGWVANAFFEQEKDSLIAEFGSERAALSETIKFIHDREATLISARSTVADRMRVARFMTRERYDDLLEETVLPYGKSPPSFHQIRACLITDKGEIDHQKSEEMLMWCVENDWPTVQEIREHRNGTELLSPEERRWQRFVDMAFCVSKDYNQYNPRFIAARSVTAQSLEEARMK